MHYSCGCSCSCGYDPCGCQATPCYNCNTTTTITTTTTINPNCEPCDELYDCNCIIYNGPDLTCYGVHNGDNLCKLLEIAASNLPGCTTTTTIAVTTTTTCVCFSYTLSNLIKQGSTVSVSYIPCGAIQQTIEYIRPRDSKVVCVANGSIPTITSTGNSENGRILLNGCCITPPPPPPKIKRCNTNNYVPIENFGAKNGGDTDFPYTFILNSMILDGLQYVTSTTPILTINSESDLQIGIGLNGQPYPMNINDWLTIIAKGSGFIFYDNVTVIDSPTPNSTLNIIISSNSALYNIDFVSGVNRDTGYTFAIFNCDNDPIIITTSTTAAPTTTTTSTTAAPTTTTSSTTTSSTTTTSTTAAPTTTTTSTTTSTTSTTTTTTTAAPTVFTVTNNSSSNYIINGVSNPTLNLIEGQTYTFNVNATGHPFWIKTISSIGTGNAYNTGVTNNGTASGTIIFVVPYTAPGTLYYNCQFHSGMAGTINVTNVS